VRHATTGDSPYYMVTGDMPSFKNLKVFGCRASVLILPTPSKFERRSTLQLARAREIRSGKASVDTLRGAGYFVATFAGCAAREAHLRRTPNY
jgi:hypothetical protein